MIRKIIRRSAIYVAALALCLGICGGAASLATPDSYQVRSGEPLSWKSGLLSVKAPPGGVASVEAVAGKKSSEAELMLFGSVPVKTVQVSAVREASVIPCGTPFGIKLFTNGVVVVGLADIQTAQGMQNPGTSAGLCVGDIIETVNGVKPSCNEAVAQIMENCEGQPVNLEIDRGGIPMEIQMQPVRSAVDGSYKAGLWVRDSTAGIGTLTFYDPETGAFAGLGHGICDTDTNELMPLGFGDILPVSINGVVKGQCGLPGELKGYFSSDLPVGSLQANVMTGVYGNMTSEFSGNTMKVALRQEVKPGPVKILSTIDGNPPQAYDAVIEKVDYRGSTTTKNLVVHVTDPRLLNATGGIVQGMSGSPILQNGMLAGAVTHVFINDPTRGYGIFAESMLKTSDETSASVGLAS